jgi:type I site-specific restriction endonuclease
MPADDTLSRVKMDRVLFLVDRFTLARRAEDTFAECIADYSRYVLCGRRRLPQRRAEAGDA